MARIDFMNSSWGFAEDTQKEGHFVAPVGLFARTPLMRSIVGVGLAGERVEFRGGEKLELHCAVRRYVTDSDYRFMVMVNGKYGRIAWIDPRTVLALLP